MSTSGGVRPTAHERGAGWAAFARADGELYAAYRALADVPWRTGTLDPRVRELLLIAADATASGPDPAGLAGRIENALALGASRAEIAEVLALVGILGIHTSTMGTAILMEEAAAQGLPAPDPHAPAAVAARAEFERRRGYWSPLWDAVVAFDPEFLLAYLEFSSVPVEREILHPHVRELVLIVVNSVATHLFPDGLRLHIRNALRIGVEPQQVMEVFELLAALGSRSLVLGHPLLADAPTPTS